MAELKPGRKAPAFTLMDKDGEKISLKKIEADYTIVYFYPKDNTPGCTIEARDFNKARHKFEQIGAVVVGIGGGDQKTKEKFCSRFKLKIDLVSDPDFKVAAKYGAYGEKSFMGKKFKGIFRKTFVLDEDKKILKIYEKVQPAGHAKEILTFLKELEKA